MYFYAYFAGITGNALPKDIEYFISNGANHVITKPLTKAKLIDALHSFCDGRRGVVNYFS